MSQLNTKSFLKIEEKKYTQEGPGNYVRILIEHNRNRQLRRGINDLAKTKTSVFENGEDVEITDDEIQNIVGYDVDISDIPDDSEYTNASDNLVSSSLNTNIPTMQTSSILPENIINNPNVENIQNKISNPFSNSPKGLGTFGDLEKLLNFSGGINNVISLLSKFFHLDLSIIEKINDISGTVTSIINQLVPGSTTSLLNNNIPTNLIKSAMPDMIEANPNIPGATKLNNLNKQIENRSTELDMKFQSFGKTENKIIQKPNPIIPKPDIEIPNLMKPPNFASLVSFPDSMTTNGSETGTTSKIEGILTPISARNNMIVIEKINMILNLQLKNNKLIGTAFLNLKGNQNQYDATYNNNSIILNLEDIFGTLVKKRVTGTIILNRTSQPRNDAETLKFTFEKPSFLNGVKDEDNIIDLTNKTAKLNVISKGSGSLNLISSSDSSTLLYLTGVYS